MNERIKQITGQVLDEIVPYTWTTLGYDEIKEIQNRTAELIVRECAMIARSTKREVDVDGGAVMRKYFGVDE